jgi:hypothetical protein
MTGQSWVIKPCSPDFRSFMFGQKGFSLQKVCLMSNVYSQNLHGDRFCGLVIKSSWLKIQRSGFDSQRYHIFWVVVGLKRCPLSLVSTNEALLGRKSSGSGLREYGRRDPSHWPRDTLYPQRLTLASPTGGGRSVGTVRSWTQATKFNCLSSWEWRTPGT